MLALKPNPYIFVHIPKCAGTSIEQALIPISTPYRGFADLPAATRSEHWLPGRQNLQHSKMRRYARQHVLKDYFVFTHGCPIKEHPKLRK